MSADLEEFYRRMALAEDRISAVELRLGHTDQRQARTEVLLGEIQVQLLKQASAHEEGIRTVIEKLDALAEWTYRSFPRGNAP